MWCGCSRHVWSILLVLWYSMHLLLLFSTTCATDSHLLSKASLCFRACDRFHSASFSVAFGVLAQPDFVEATAEASIDEITWTAVELAVASTFVEKNRRCQLMGSRGWLWSLQWRVQCYPFPKELPQAVRVVLSLPQGTTSSSQGTLCSLKFKEPEQSGYPAFLEQHC